MVDMSTNIDYFKNDYSRVIDVQNDPYAGIAGKASADPLKAIVLINKSIGDNDLPKAKTDLITYVKSHTLSAYLSSTLQFLIADKTKLPDTAKIVTKLTADIVAKKLDIMDVYGLYSTAFFQSKDAVAEDQGIYEELAAAIDTILQKTFGVSLTKIDKVNKAISDLRAPTSNYINIITLLCEAYKADKENNISFPGYANAEIYDHIRLVLTNVVDKQLQKYKGDFDKAPDSATAVTAAQNAWKTVNLQIALANIISAAELPAESKTLITKDFTQAKKDIIDGFLARFASEDTLSKGNAAQVKTYYSNQKTVKDFFAFIDGDDKATAAAGSKFDTYTIVPNTKYLETFTINIKAIDDACATIATDIGLPNILGKLSTISEGDLKTYLDKTQTAKAGIYALVFDDTPTGKTTQSVIEAAYKKLSAAAKKPTDVTLLDKYIAILSEAQDALLAEHKVNTLIDALTKATSLPAISTLLEDTANKALATNPRVQEAAKNRADDALAKAATNNDLDKFQTLVQNDPEVTAESLRRKALIKDIAAVVVDITKPTSTKLQDAHDPISPQYDKKQAAQDLRDKAATAAVELLKTGDKDLGQRLLALYKMGFYSLRAQYAALGTNHDTAYKNDNSPKISDPAAGLTVKSRNEADQEIGTANAITTPEYDYYPTRTAQNTELGKLLALIQKIDIKFKEIIPTLEAVPTALTDIVTKFWDTSAKKVKDIATVTQPTELQAIIDTIEANTEYIVYNKDAILAIYDSLLTLKTVIDSRDKAFDKDKLKVQTDSNTTLTTYPKDTVTAAQDLVKANDPISIAKLKAELAALTADYAKLSITWSDAPKITIDSTGIETKQNIQEHEYFVRRKDIFDRIMQLRTILTPNNLAGIDTPTAILDQPDQTKLIQDYLNKYYIPTNKTINQAEIDKLSLVEVSTIITNLDRYAEFIGYAGITLPTSISPAEALLRARAIYTTLFGKQNQSLAQAEAAMKAMLINNQVNPLKRTPEELARAEAARTTLPIDNAVRIAYEKALLSDYATLYVKYVALSKVNYNNDPVNLNKTQDAIGTDEEKPATYYPQTVSDTWTLTATTSPVTLSVKEATEYAQALAELFTQLQTIQNVAITIAAERKVTLPSPAITKLPDQFNTGKAALEKLKNSPVITIKKQAEDIINTFQDNAEYLSAIASPTDRSAIIKTYAQALAYVDAYNRIKPTLETISANNTLTTSDEDLKTLTTLLTQTASKADLQKIKDDPTLQQLLLSATKSAIKEASTLALTPQRIALENLKTALERAKTEKTISNADALIALINDQLRDSTRAIINTEYDRLSKKLQDETNNKATRNNLDTTKAALLALTNDPSKDLPGYDKVIKDFEIAYAADLQNYTNTAQSGAQDSSQSDVKGKTFKF